MERILITLDRHDIAYVRFIFEGYDGLGILSTVDRTLAQAIVAYPTGNHTAVQDLLGALQNEGVIKEVHAA